MKKNYLKLQKDPIDVGTAFTFLQTPEAGGVSLFVGTTRRWTQGRETVHLEYECYEVMALKEMDLLATEARKRWPIKRLCMIHRVGEVPFGEASVVVGVATPHRDAAFALLQTLEPHLLSGRRRPGDRGTPIAPIARRITARASGAALVSNAMNASPNIIPRCMNALPCREYNITQMAKAALEVA